jgi:hypothetical protein
MTRHKSFASESDLAAHIVAWLHQQHYDVYQEVQPGRGEPVADIVAVQGPLVVIVETKLSFGWPVIEQAYQWAWWANLVYCGVPSPRIRRGGVRGVAAQRAMEAIGVGVLEVAPWDAPPVVEEYIRPVFRRVPFGRGVTHFDIRPWLRDEQKTACAAGSAGGGYWTPYKATCRALREYVVAHPGCTMREAVAGIETHYRRPATAYGCLSQWLRAGKIPGVGRDEGGQLVSLPIADERPGEGGA